MNEDLATAPSHVKRIGGIESTFPKDTHMLTTA